MSAHVQAAQAGAANRFSLTGTGTLKSPTPMQAHGSLQMKATLAISGGEGGGASAQQGAAFGLTAKLAAVPLVCNSDTIFANGFDP
jgi:hypothetical protein